MAHRPSTHAGRQGTYPEKRPRMLRRQWADPSRPHHGLPACYQEGAPGGQRLRGGRSWARRHPPPHLPPHLPATLLAIRSCSRGCDAHPPPQPPPSAGPAADPPCCATPPTRCRRAIAAAAPPPALQACLLCIDALLTSLPRGGGAVVTRLGRGSMHGGPGDAGEGVSTCEGPGGGRWGVGGVPGWRGRGGRGAPGV